MDVLEGIGVAVGGGGSAAGLVILFLRMMEGRIFRAEAKALTSVSMKECDTHREKIRDDIQVQEDCVESELIEIKEGQSTMCSDLKVIKSAMILTSDDPRVVALLTEE